MRGTKKKKDFSLNGARRHCWSREPKHFPNCASRFTCTTMSTSSAIAFAPASLEARVAMINGYFDLPDDALAAMKEVRQILDQAAYAIYALADKNKNADKGTLVRVMQKLQSTKDVACQAFILPHYKKPEVIGEDLRMSM